MARKSADPRTPQVAAPVIALDTNCVIALVCGWHEHHEVTSVLVTRRLAAGATLSIPAPVLVEAYAVLTRLPAPHRLAPADVLRLLRENFHGPALAHTATLGAADYWSLLDGAAAGGLHGGRTYDVVIAACARKAHARELLTLNLRHFESFGDDALQITSPAET